MNEIATINMLLDLPQQIIIKSKEYNEYAVLLRKEIYDSFDTKQLKQSITKGFNRYKDIMYLIKFPDQCNIYKSQSFEIHENMFTRKNTDVVGNIVMHQIDEQLWATEFYNKILCLSSKLTTEEICYMTSTFFKNQSEEVISEKLGICRNTLRGIKKSCLVKTWIELQTLIDKL